MFETNPIDLKDLLDDVEEGKIQLPDFQRAGFGTMNASRVCSSVYPASSRWERL